MRTSRVSKETSKLLGSTSSSTSSGGRRTTRRTGKALSAFSYDGGESKPQNTDVKLATPSIDASRISPISEDEVKKGGDSSGLSSANTTDIEDLLSPGLSRKRKRKQNDEGSVPMSTSPRPQAIKSEDTGPRKVNSRRLPARKNTSTSGVSTVDPPSNWETIYSTVKEMRRQNPTAPVDTVGCSELYWDSSSPRERRLHILIALMLSSQTKDTVTAMSMQRLHTELDSDSGADVKKEEEEEENKGKLSTVTPKRSTWDHAKQQAKSTLTLENILAVSPSRLNELIGAVGFHNNKTKYIKSAALILRDEYSSDIPSNAKDLMKLPGVGPKMAYLCMSAAWGRDEGIGVDVHVHRITNLWGWHKTKTPEETRAALESWLPRDKWHEINKLLVGLGQTVCLPVARRCGECDLAGSGLCKSEIKGSGANEKSKRKR